MKVITHSRKSSAGKILASKAWKRKIKPSSKLYKSSNNMSFREQLDAIRMRKLLKQ
jgi:hypothetical protein